MDQAIDEESVGDAGFANEFSANEASMDLGTTGAIHPPLEVGNTVF